ncbi:Protein kinase domain-containing protein, cytoplasmic [Aphelenchoides bicaudatus]|nr:Protein kinase domain-containing protein, cytoplasmic [Aphelenchoides bicaudatus]
MKDRESYYIGELEKLPVSFDNTCFVMQVEFLAESETFKVREFLPLMRRVGSEWRFDSNETFGDCSQIPLDFKNEPLIGQGYSKQVFKYGQVAIKRPLLKEGRAFSRMHAAFLATCLNNEMQGFIGEVGLLQKLQGDPNVPKLFAYCIPFDLKQSANEMAAVVELGESIDTIKYINELSWKKRLNFVDEVLAFVERVQPLVFLDFRRQQFTLRQNKQPMYVDFDNVAIESNHTVTDSETARRVYNTFANKYLWIGRPSGSATILNRIRRQFNENQLNLTGFSTSNQRVATFLN